ncbi:patatin-like phospholipase family protein [Pontibacter chitinilyticus]|uniref:patatin-like phospholipase family protein n=1 Tax=Pontibacter chitinilyticus TaxID=2674989 RepID=UPI00321AA590
MDAHNIAAPHKHSPNNVLSYAWVKKNLAHLFPNLEEHVLDDLLQKFRWRSLKRGEVLCREGDAGDSLYLLVSGRLKALIGADTPHERQVGEVSQGECVGEMALMTGEPRTATIQAARDCTLVQLLKSDFDTLISLHPQVVLSLSRMVINRLNYTMHHAAAPAKLSNIALVPATNSPEINVFIHQLVAELRRQGPFRHLHAGLLPEEFKTKADRNAPISLALGNWLAEQELEQELVVYEAEAINSYWTQQCLRHADKIIIISQASESITLSAIENTVFHDNDHHALQREQVFLYPEATEQPSLSRQLLALRSVNRHYNIRQNDGRHLSRLARMLLNRGIGLVLGGGGAKGFAHIGIYRALQEAGVPVDMVCGTSMGAIIAAGIAHEWDAEQLRSKVKSAIVTDKPLNDYTLPVLSLLKGHKFQQTLKKYFRDQYIEDLWLNFFCISSNYTLSEMVIHEEGLLWKAVAASASIPGVLPPMVKGNDLLVDGGTFNNFPVDVMKEHYGGKLIGINLLIDKAYELDYTTLPGGWHLFFSRFLPFLRRYKSPSISAIILKSTTLPSIVHQRQQIDDLDLFMTPPVGNFSLLALNNYDKIVATGYEYGSAFLQEAPLHKLTAK